jgi:hypothetical protein
MIVRVHEIDGKSCPLAILACDLRVERYAKCELLCEIHNGLGALWRLFVAQGCERIDLRCAASGQVGREERDGE